MTLAGFERRLRDSHRFLHRNLLRAPNQRARVNQKDERNSKIADWEKYVVYEIEIEGLYQPWVAPRRQDRRSSYVSIAQGFLLQHLRHLDTLNLYNLDIAKDYPPLLPSLIVRFPIRHLTLWNCSLALSNIFRIIWSLDNLHSLTLHHDVHPSDTSSISTPLSTFAAESEKLQMMQLRRPRQCRELRSLTLGVGTACL